MTVADITPSDDAFTTLKAISRYTRFPDLQNEGRDLLIRFLDSYPGTSVEISVVDCLCAHFGLYPYMSPIGNESAAEALAVELHTPGSLASEGFTFHSEQQRVYQRLMDGESLILSAPTSFGKSVVVDALIASGKWNNIVIIVPTIALIDETRRRLARFSSDYRVITHPNQEFGGRNILVLTQERFLEVPDLPDIDLFMIDEFYKLGSFGPIDSRGTMLNLAWDALKRTGAQYYLTGPNIDALDSRLSDELLSHLVVTEYKTVAVDVEDRSDAEDHVADLLELMPGLDGPTLLFTASPARAETLGMQLVEARVMGEVNDFVADVAEWMGDAFDAEWKVVLALGSGVAIHTGPLPRSLQRIMVRLFNDGMVDALVCTTTLIEGVNTAAKNVIILDKKIDGQLIDFFTFSNVRGRAGRMFRHFVGNVITYMAPPDRQETEVDIPIESQSAEANLATLIQIPEDSLTDEAKERLAHVLEQNELSVDTIRNNRGINPDRQIDVAQRLKTETPTVLEELSWTGMPTNNQARQVLRVAFEELLESRQRRGMNFERMWGLMQGVRRAPTDFSGLVDSQMGFAFKGQDRSDVVNTILSFQRNWMGFTIPSMIRTIQSIGSEILPQRGNRRGNYELMLRDIENLYLPRGLMDLEEYGLPLALASRLVPLGLGTGELPDLLARLTEVSQSERVRAQLSNVELWILDDVIAGLGV